MSEQETNKATEKSTSTEADGRGNKPEVYKPIDDANLAAKRMEEATKALREENDRREDMMAKAALGGGSEGGSGEVKTEETPQEYAKKVISGAYNG